MSTLFGRQKRFAIECEMDDPPTQFFNCELCIWAGGERIGVYQRGSSLRVSVGFFQYTLNHVGQRYIQTLADKSADEILTVVYNGVYNVNDEDTPLEEIDANWQKYGKLIICPGGGPAFDGWLVVLLECLDHERLIWRERIEEAHEVQLERGEYKEVVQLFLDWSSHMI